MRMSRFTTTAVAAAALALVVPAAAASSAPAPSDSKGGDDHSAPALEWQPCFEERTAETGVIFECTQFAVPLDHDRPHGDTIDIALTRIPALDQSAKRGSILLNPGGPGGSGVDFVVGFGPFAGFALSPEIPQLFDLVGFDPRGIARSTPIRCFETVDEAVQVFPPFPFPIGRDEVRLVRDLARELADACRAAPDARRIGRHMSTANVARDMDLIRAAVGDERLNFLGLSYGTFLGANYANLFPDRVGSVVVDGVLDPVAWVNLEHEVPFSTRLRSDEGAAETLAEFFVQCEAAAPGNCALAPNSSDRFDALMASLLEAPRVLVDPGTGDQFVVTYRDVIGGTLGDLYNPFAYAGMAQILAAIESAPPAGSAVFAGASRWSERFEHIQPYDNFVEGFPAVACADTTNPRSYRVFEQAGLEAEETYGYYGRIWTWAASPCPRWPFRDRDRYEGPFDHETANPVLVIGNLYDPATRYEGAQTLRGLLPNSALLSVDVPGHTSLGLSGCAGFVTAQYLLDPAFANVVDGQTCPPEFNAFDVVAGPPPAPTATTAEATPRSRTAPRVSDTAVRAQLRDMLDEVVGIVP